MATKLNINPTITYSGVLDFDGSVYASGGGGLDASANKTLRWKMWLDSSTHNNLECIFSFSTDSVDHLNVHFTNTGAFIVYTSNTVSGSISGFTSDAISADHINKVIQCEVKKETSKFIHFKIDDVSLTGGPGGTQGVSDSCYIGSQGIGSFMDKATVWDVEYIDDVLVETVHSWKGYPAGNTDAAWVDDVSTKDLTVKTSPPTGVPINTRDIEGVPSGSVSSWGKKLELDPNANSLLYLQGTFVETPFFSFVTDASTDNITPIIEASTGLPEWDFGDGTPRVEDDNPNHTYTLPGNKTVNVYQNTLDLDTISRISLASDNVVGELDLSGFTKADILTFHYNSKLTSVINPINDERLRYYYATDCSIVGTLDLTPFSQFGGDVLIERMQGLTEILIGESDNITATNFRIQYLGIQTLDVSGMHNMGPATFGYNDYLSTLLLPDSSYCTYISVQYCPSLRHLDASAFLYFTGSNIQYSGLESFIFPETNSNISSLIFNNANLQDIDFTPLGDKFGGSIRLGTNPSLNSIENPVSSRTFTTYDFSNCNVTGTLDVSGLTGLGGYFSGFSNDNLTIVLNPVSSETFSRYDVGHCNITGTIDVSGLTGIGGWLDFSSNSSLTSILFPASSTTITRFYADTCNLTGTLDISGLSGFGGWIYLHSNSNLTEILFPTSSTSITRTYLLANDLKNLDISGLTNISGVFNANDNFELSSITFPSSIGAIYTMEVNDGSLDQTTVNTAFSLLDTYFSSNTPTAAGIYDFSGNTNMPPTDGSSNSNILSLETIFSNAGQTLTITINT